MSFAKPLARCLATKQDCKVHTKYTQNTYKTHTKYAHNTHKKVVWSPRTVQTEPPPRSNRMDDFSPRGQASGRGATKSKIPASGTKLRPREHHFSRDQRSSAGKATRDSASAGNARKSSVGNTVGGEQKRMGWRRQDTRIGHGGHGARHDSHTRQHATRRGSRAHAARQAEKKENRVVDTLDLDTTGAGKEKERKKRFILFFYILHCFSLFQFPR